MVTFPLLLAVLIESALVVGLMLWFVYLFLYRAPFVPTRRAICEEMLARAGAKPGMRVIDLGAGSGDMVIAAARRGCTAVGVECSPLLVMLSRRRIRRAGLEKSATMRVGNLFAEPLADADIVMVFLLSDMLAELREKFSRELPPHAVVVSHCFPIRGWVPSYSSSAVKVYRLPQPPVSITDRPSL